MTSLLHDFSSSGQMVSVAVLGLFFSTFGWVVPTSVHFGSCKSGLDAFHNSAEFSFLSVSCMSCPHTELLSLWLCSPTPFEGLQRLFQLCWSFRLLRLGTCEHNASISVERFLSSETEIESALCVLLSSSTANARHLSCSTMFSSASVLIFTSIYVTTHFVLQTFPMGDASSGPHQLGSDILVLFLVILWAS